MRIPVHVLSLLVFFILLPFTILMLLAIRLILRAITPLLPRRSGPRGRPASTRPPFNRAAAFIDGEFEQLECVFCLSSMEADDKVTRLTCRHVFHSSCLQRWLDFRRSTCPLCRRCFVSAAEAKAKAAAAEVHGGLESDEMELAFFDFVRNEFRVW